MVRAELETERTHKKPPMTFAELAAAIWDQREITLETAAGTAVTGIPLAVDRRELDGTRLWLVHYRTGRVTVASAFVRIRAFDGHSGET